MILYISYIDDPRFNSGVWKKMNGQLKAFQKSFPSAALTYIYNQMAFLWNGDQLLAKKHALHRKAYSEVLKNWILEYNVKQVYIRYFLSDLFFIDLLQFLKENSIKVILEIPTFPYDNEFRFGVRKFEDSIYRQEINKYLDRVVTYSNDDNIWGIKCFNLYNGMDFSNIDSVIGKTSEHSLRLLAVSLMFPWHGYERLIEGLKDYYLKSPERQVLVSLVGTGVQEKYYRLLTEKYNLEKYITFWGSQQGNLLEQIYMNSDIGIGSLGFYKAHGNFGSTLKIGEYCAHGLPAVCGYKDNRFPENTPFILQVPNNSSPLDIQKIVDFYDNLAQDEDYNVKIQQYAREHLSWDRVMQPVIKYLKDEE